MEGALCEGSSTHRTLSNRRPSPVGSEPVPRAGPLWPCSGRGRTGRSGPGGQRRCRRVGASCGYACRRGGRPYGRLRPVRASSISQTRKRWRVLEQPAGAPHPTALLALAASAECPAHPCVPWHSGAGRGQDTAAALQGAAGHLPSRPAGAPIGCGWRAGQDG